MTLIVRFLAKFVNSSKHCHDIFWRYIGHNVMNCVEDKTTARGKDFDVFTDMIFDYLGRGSV